MNIDYGLIVAIFALFLTVWQMKATAQHNRLSTKPIISLKTTYSKSRIVQIDIINDGLGPAIINELVVFLSNRPVVTIKKQGDQEKMI